MFIKLNGRVTSSDAIDSISIEPVHLKPFTSRIWVDRNDGMRIALGTFLNEADARRVLDECLFPAMQNNESIDMDFYYMSGGVDTMELVHLVMNDSERREWYEKHRHLFDTGESGNEKE